MSCPLVCVRVSAGFLAILHVPVSRWEHADVYSVLSRSGGLFRSVLAVVIMFWSALAR